jgi:hypothetical protein
MRAHGCINHAQFCSLTSSYRSSTAAISSTGFMISIDYRSVSTTDSSVYESDHTMYADKPPTTLSVEVSGPPEPAELCFTLTVRDLSKHTLTSSPFCADVHALATAKSGAPSSDQNQSGGQDQSGGVAQATGDGGSAATSTSQARPPIPG